MMSSAGTSRANRHDRSSKDKPTKSAQQQTQNVKTEGPPKNQVQPTPEQMRLAQMISDKNDIEDPVLKEKVAQVMELTGRTEDEVLVALHDCDNDSNRATNMLLEGENDQGEWQESGKRRKRQVNASKVSSDLPALETRPDRREKSRDGGDRISDRQDSQPPRRGRQPPRLARKNRENEQNDRFHGDNDSQDRGFERGRGRGRGQMNGRGRGRGRYGRDRSNRFEREKGPTIGTWTNETAEAAEKENSTWPDTEDWGDEWTGGIEDSKDLVFTPSTAADSSNLFSAGMGDNDAKMFTPPPAMSVESQVFSASMSMASGGSMPSPALNDSTNTLHSVGTSSLQNSIGSTGLGQSVQQDSISQNGLPPSSHSLGQRLDLSMLLGQPKPQTESDAYLREQQFISQATESLRHAVGLGPSVSSASPVVAAAPIISRTAHTLPAAPSQPTAVHQSLGSHGQATQVQQSQAPSRPKQQRSKLPPPSKIPATAVVMPGHSGSFQLDVQFGNWDIGSSDSGFSINAPNPDNSSVSSSYAATITTSSTPTASSLSNHIPQVSKSAAETTAVISAAMTSAVTSQQSSISSLDSLSQQGSMVQSSPRQPSNMYQSSSANTTPQKNYSQSPLSHHNKMTPPEPIPFPLSQADRKTSPHFSTQRSGQSSVAVSLGGSNSSSTKPTSSQGMAAYGQPSGYGSNYQSSSYQSQKTSSYTHPSNNLGQGVPQNHMTNSSQNQYGHSTHQGYPSSSFQSQNAFSNQGPSSLYHQSSSQPGVYQSQSGSSAYQNQSGSSYQGQSSSYQNPSAYHSSRDSQSASSYQPSGSQSSSSYQSGTGQSGSAYQTSVNQSGSAYQTTVSQGSAYQRDSQSAQSGYSSHQSYGSGSHQNSLQTSPMNTMSNTNKLTDSLSKMSVKDSSSIDTHQTSQHTYDHTTSPSTNSASLNTTTATTATPLATGNMASSLGLATMASTSTLATTITPSVSTAKSLPITSKAPPNLPPGVPPLIGHNYMMQPSMPFFGLPAATQPAVYSYEDLQLMQQRLLPGYYDNVMSFQPPTTITGRDQGTIANVPYSGTDGKLNRLDAQSPVQAQTTQQQQQTQSAAQQQAFINPTIPPGYANYYYPGLQLPSGYSYTPTMFPVPSVTNAAAHGGTTANAQFQKPGAYGSHTYAGYEDLTNQTQDFSKYGTASQTQAKAGASVSSVTGTDLTAAYGKAHTQSFDKAGFPAGTPPPFSLLPSGSQGVGPMAAPTAAAPYGTPYVPMMAHQSQILHHHLQQDSTGGSSRGSQQSANQVKANAAKTYAPPYWATT